MFFFLFFFIVFYVRPKKDDLVKCINKKLFLSTFFATIRQKARQHNKRKKSYIVEGNEQ